MNLEKRNIVTCILLSLITCGIYGIYWMIKLNDDANTLTGQVNVTSGGMVVLYTFITCGIYGFYWMYKQGEKMDQIKAANGQNSSNTSIMYLILAVIGLGVINYCLMQNIINDAIDARYTQQF